MVVHILFMITCFYSCIPKTDIIKKKCADTANESSECEKIEGETTDDESNPAEIDGVNPVEYGDADNSQPGILFAKVILKADTSITPKIDELVTFGLPLKQGIESDVSKIKVMVGNTEIPSFVKSTLTYHWIDNSIRSITVQLQNIDMTSGDVEVIITNNGSSFARLIEKPHKDGWTSAGINKDNLFYPRIFAIHDLEYLKKTSLIPPYEIAPKLSDAFSDYQNTQFDSWAGGLNFVSSSNANWLFDRSSAMFKAYMVNGDVKYLKEAFLSKQFYFKHVRNDGTSPAASGGAGCWTYGSVSCADGKYIAPQQAKLALALLGDESQWDNQLIINMALQADLGWNQYASRDIFDEENEGFTERGAGMAGLAEINAFEMTGDSTVFSHINERINSLYDMQQTEKSWDIANGWTPKSGGFSHNIDVHEGNQSASSAPKGDANARGFSAWMSENISDFLWQTYWITGNSKIPSMLTKLANAIDLYGFTSTYDESTENYIRKTQFLAGSRAMGCNTNRDFAELLYFASAIASPAGTANDDWWPWYSDSHNIETIHILATGLYFESDPQKRKRLVARINLISDSSINTGCANVSSTKRLWNWQHRSNSYRTWSWVKDQKKVIFIPEMISI